MKLFAFFETKTHVSIYSIITNNIITTLWRSQHFDYKDIWYGWRKTNEINFTTTTEKSVHSVKCTSNDYLNSLDFIQLNVLSLVEELNEFNVVITAQNVICLFEETKIIMNVVFLCVHNSLEKWFHHCLSLAKVFELKWLIWSKCY